MVQLLNLRKINIWHCTVSFVYLYILFIYIYIKNNLCWYITFIDYNINVTTVLSCRFQLTNGLLCGKFYQYPWWEEYWRTLNRLEIKPYKFLHWGKVKLFLNEASVCSSGFDCLDVWWNCKGNMSSRHYKSSQSCFRNCTTQRWSYWPCNQ
jgi:hypothetical protein